MKKTIPILFALLLCLGLSRPVPAGPESARAGVATLLSAQVQAWNRGDLNAFMQGYWLSGRTEYVGSSGIVQGWKAIQRRYRRTYQQGKSMGRLRFKNLKVTMLAPDAALAVGEYVLQSRKDGAKTSKGVFTLVLRRFPEGWRIINDHTSAYTAKP